MWLLIEQDWNDLPFLGSVDKVLGDAEPRSEGRPFLGIIVACILVTAMWIGLGLALLAWF